MSRIAGVFDALRQSGRKALIPYVVAGDPDPTGTVALLHELVASGADVIEVGVPFSDPMAEGPVIQKGHERALANGMTLRKVLSFVAEFRQQNTQTPIVMMGYANPIERFGYEAFACSGWKGGLASTIRGWGQRRGTAEGGVGDGGKPLPKRDWGCGKWGKKASKPLDAPRGWWDFITKPRW